MQVPLRVYTLPDPANHASSLHLRAPRRHGIYNLFLRTHSPQTVTLRPATDG